MGKTNIRGKKAALFCSVKPKEILCDVSTVYERKVGAIKIKYDSFNLIKLDSKNERGAKMVLKVNKSRKDIVVILNNIYLLRVNYRIHPNTGFFVQFPNHHCFVHTCRKYFHWLNHFFVC